MCELEGEVMQQAMEPEDPQDHECKRICGRLAGGLIADTHVHDLQEVVRWLNSEIHYRLHPYVAPKEPF